MSLPGRAWLQFEVEPAPGGSIIRQTAIFDPVGCSGRLYWYAVWPVHGFVFNGMIRGIARAAAARRPPRARRPRRHDISRDGPRRAAGPLDGRQPRGPRREDGGGGLAGDPRGVPPGRERDAARPRHAHRARARRRRPGLDAPPRGRRRRGLGGGRPGAPREDAPLERRPPRAPRGADTRGAGRPGAARRLGRSPRRPAGRRAERPLPALRRDARVGVGAAHRLAGVGPRLLPAGGRLVARRGRRTGGSSRARRAPPGAAGRRPGPSGR